MWLILVMNIFAFYRKKNKIVRLDGFWVGTVVKSPNSLWIQFQYHWSEHVKMWEFIIKSKNINTVKYLKIIYNYIFISYNLKLISVTQNTVSILKGRSISSSK